MDKAQVSVDIEGVVFGIESPGLTSCLALAERVQAILAR
ncbi:hypothetical protein PS710_00061 [Pseudomonas fluorescens]|uniref:Uncharacterized protein n=1 Tax=Pseudomonas fluorescens TaxID=294 RepID=A0A5E6ZKJ5_PSEFL|nr:hypothetical protein PS710_00061 [Pseudomonas fluorescens]